VSRGLMLITGATGLVGSHVAERAVEAGYDVRALVRDHMAPSCRLLANLGVELKEGDLRDYVVHAAGAVGEWGDSKFYRDVNVDGLMNLLETLVRTSSLKRLVALSSLSVYAPRHHFGTNEKVPIYLSGFDEYARTKTEAELILREYMSLRKLPTVILRPGFIYGARDRHVLPRIIPRIKAGRFAYLGHGKSLMDNTGVHNLADAIMIALDAPGIVGETFNLTDERLITRIELVETIAKLLGVAPPRIFIPEPMAKPLAKSMEHLSRTLGIKNPPLLSMARYKFLALHRQFSIDKAKSLLHYAAKTSFHDGMAEAVTWYIREGAAS
jgi:2-alkyl-3-oxoalkanoate reductase